MKINGYVAPGVLVVAILAAVYAYGQQSEKIEELEKTPLKVQMIAENQAGMRVKIEALVRAQEAFRYRIEKTLDRILRKLDAR